MKRAWDRSSNHTRIKLCEFESLDAAYEASFLGADMLGFHLFAFQDHLVRANQFAEIFRYLPNHIDKTLLTNLTGRRLEEVLSRIQVDTIQLYNQATPDEILALRRRLGEGGRILKVMSEKSVENGCDDAAFIARYADLVDGLLLDSAWIGGTGVAGDWDHCAAIVKQSPIPVFLAGGLTADNVRHAIDQVRPFGVDVENGVSDRMPDGRRVKNLLKCRLFVEKAREADWLLGRNNES